MIKCPFCGENIEDEAVSCKSCGWFSSRPAAGMRADSKKIKWYFQTSFIIVALLCNGSHCIALDMVEPANQWTMENRPHRCNTRAQRTDFENNLGIRSIAEGILQACRKPLIFSAGLT